jgi:hypothetical protein
MVQMAMMVKVSLIVLVGLLVGLILLYHAWLDRRLARERTVGRREDDVREDTLLPRAKDATG